MPVSSSSGSASASSGLKKRIHATLKKTDLKPTQIVPPHTPNLLPARGAAAAPVAAAAAATPAAVASAAATSPEPTGIQAYATPRNLMILAAVILVLVLAYFVYKKWSVITNLGVGHAIGVTDVSKAHAAEEQELLEKGKHPFVQPAKPAAVPLPPPNPKKAQIESMLANMTVADETVAVAAAAPVAVPATEKK